MEISIKITAENGFIEATGDSSDGFDSWEITRNGESTEMSDVSDEIQAFIYSHLGK